jgi:ATP/maltotriose-dependent transcriptional regulator MalT
MVRNAPRPGGSVARTTELGLLVAKAELARVEGRPRDAVAMLRGAAAHLPAIVMPGVGDVHLDVVVALHDAGEADEAARLLADRVSLHDRSGLAGVVVFRGAALLPVLDRLHDAGIALPQVRRALQLLRPDRPSGLSTGDGQELSPREVEVLRLVAGGLSNREIAEQLVISINTVKTHVRRLNAKLGVRSRTAAAARATRLGLR